MYYAKTTNWNRIGAVMTGNAEDTAYFRVPDYIPIGNYSVQVIANGNASDAYTLDVTCSPNGIAEVKTEQTNVSVFPNPSSGQFNISVTGRLPMPSGILDIYDALGQKILDKPIRKGTTKIDMSNQPNGVYFYRVSDQSGTSVKEGSLMVQKL